MVLAGRGLAMQVRLCGAGSGAACHAQVQHSLACREKKENYEREIIALAQRRTSNGWTLR